MNNKINNITPGIPEENDEQSAVIEGWGEVGESSSADDVRPISDEEREDAIPNFNNERDPDYYKHSLVYIDEEMDYHGMEEEEPETEPDPEPKLFPQQRKKRRIKAVEAIESTCPVSADGKTVMQEVRDGGKVTLREEPDVYRPVEKKVSREDEMPDASAVTDLSNAPAAAVAGTQADKMTEVDFAQAAQEATAVYAEPEEAAQMPAVGVGAGTQADKMPEVDFAQAAQEATAVYAEPEEAAQMPAVGVGAGTQADKMPAVNSVQAAQEATPVYAEPEEAAQMSAVGVGAGTQADKMLEVDFAQAAQEATAVYTEPEEAAQMSAVGVGAGTQADKMPEVDFTQAAQEATPVYAEPEEAAQEATAVYTEPEEAAQMPAVGVGAGTGQNSKNALARKKAVIIGAAAALIIIILALVLGITTCCGGRNDLPAGGEAEVSGESGSHFADNGSGAETDVTSEEEYQAGGQQVSGEGNADISDSESASDDGAEGGSQITESASDEGAEGTSDVSEETAEADISDGGTEQSAAVSEEQTAAQSTAVTSAAETSSQSSAAVTTPNDDGQETADGYTVAYSAGNTWENSGTSMYGMEIQIKNGTSSTVSGWKLVLEIDGLASVTGWNGTYSISGNKLIVGDAGHNSEISGGGVISIGCNLGVKSELNIKSATLNGTVCTLKAGSIAANNNSGGANNNTTGGGNSGSGGNNSGSGTAPADKEELLERCDEAVQGDDWLYTDGNRIYDKNGKEVWITGVNWFGYNTGTNTFDGLWNSELVSSVEAIADHGFNLIRVPISAELINQWAAGTYPKANYNNAYNTVLNDMNSLEIFEYFLKLAEQNGLKVMMDIHSAETNASGHTVNLWCTDKVSVNEFYAALEWMAARYRNNDTIIAYDLKNEPHGKPYEGDGAAIWNNSTDANNWKYVAQTAALKVLAKNPNVLIMVEGIEIYPTDIRTNGDFSSTNDKDYYFNWWGGNLRGVRDFPINLGKYQNKLVYSPHDYGPTVYQQPWFEGSYNYSSLMKDCWYDNWFYIYDENIAPLLIGEWGGFMKEPNLKWMTCMRTLIKKYHLHHTFWCYNANSGDTGGLVLDDFKTWDEEKYAFVKEVLWQENGKFVGLDHAIPLGSNGITLSKAKGL